MTPVGLQHYLAVSVLLFCLGLLGVLVRRNVLVIYMSLELMLNAANLALVAFSRFNNNLNGQLIVFFIIEGFSSIIFATEYRQNLSGRWGWMVASGVVDLLLAAMIFLQLPSSAIWAIGLLLGINMVFGGTTLVMLALDAKKALPPT